MPTVTKINSGKGLVAFTREELVDLDLTKWIRADSKGYGKRDFISVQPIEKQAAKAYKEKFPSMQVKIAEKCFLNKDGGVEVVLRVALDISEGNYNTHPTKLTWLGDAHTKERAILPTFNEEKLKDRKATGLVLPIDFLTENIDKLSDEEKRQIYAELGEDNSEGFLENLRLAMLDSDTTIEKLAEELSTEEDNL